MKIEKGIPIPSIAAVNRWPFDAMEVGDSIAVPAGANRRAKNAACSFERSHPGVKFSIRKVGKDEWRLWRTA